MVRTGVTRVLSSLMIQPFGQVEAGFDPRRADRVVQRHPESVRRNQLLFLSDLVGHIEIEYRPGCRTV